MFRGFTCLIFSADDGYLLPNPDIEAIRCLRQVCLMLKKINIECTPKRTQAAMDLYMQCEKDIRLSDQSYIGSALQTEFKKTAKVVFSTFFYDIEKVLYADKIKPRHSNGATADRLVGNDKYRQTEWPARLHSILPWDSALLPSPRWSAEDYPVTILEPGQERPVKVIPVPKTQKTPRLIAEEPTCMQYVQQGILAIIDQIGPTDRNYWSFCQNKHQEPNQQMALIGSREGTYATLDLSEASDRVSYQHVRDLLEFHPLLLEYVDACRSRKADVPGYGVVRLAKFASMGSSLCFPFEAMVFTTVALMGCARAKGTVCDRRFLQKMIGQVRVYGDDIIVPTDCAITVRDLLEAFGFKVNSSKSFWTGKFRESCGKEYYAGSDVTLVRLKTMFPEGRGDVNELVSTVSFHNRLFEAGWFDTAAYVKHELRNFKLSEIPIGASSVIGFYSYSPNYQVRWDKNLHKPLIKAHAKIDIIPKNGIDGHLALTKFFLERGELSQDPPLWWIPAEISKPLAKSAYSHSGRPRSARIKTGWYDLR